MAFRLGKLFGAFEKRTPGSVICGIQYILRLENFDKMLDDGFS